MKKIVAKRNVCLVLVLLLMVAFLLTVTCSITAKAAIIGETFEGYSGKNVATKDLYDYTNTYDYINNNEPDGSEKYRRHQYYNVSEKGHNDNNVSGVTQITVLTHGLGGDASDWSNINGEFAYDKESLISILAEDKDAQIYWAKMKTHNSFRLVDLNNSSNIKTSGIYQDADKSQTVTKITDISKHIILVFESTHDATLGYNNYIYEEFNYMLSKIVYDVKCLNDEEKLPKINLIGHSRGGITNLQYALDHPDMVDSIFSMGTPYFGSDTAATSIGESISESAKEGLNDIIDRSLYLDYYYRWNTNRGKDNWLYKNITVHALGGYSDTDFVFEALLADPEFIAGEGFDPEILEWIKRASKTLFGSCLVNGLGNLAFMGDQLKSLFRGKNYTESEFERYEQILADIQCFDKYSSIWSNIKHKFPYIGSPYFMNDLLVDLPSQLGDDAHSQIKANYGFTTFARCFSKKDYASDSDKKIAWPGLPAVVHNLEPRDKTFIQYIKKNIGMGVEANRWLYEISDDNTMSVYGYVGSKVDENGVLVIPSELAGYSVNEISDYAFNGVGERNSIVSVIIPSSVKRVGECAFAECEGLESVVFENSEDSTANQSEFVILGNNCYSGCTALTDVSLPEHLSFIGGLAFSGCTSLKNITLGKNVEFVGSDAFFGCESLESIEVGEGNAKYCSQDGVLFDTTDPDYKMLVCYPAAKKATSYTLPSGVKAVVAYAFYENTTLIEVDLNDVEAVYGYAFYGCENLAEITADKLKYAYENAFGNTAWENSREEENAPEFIAVGSTLIKYNGKAKELVLQGYTHIACGAFADNVNIERVVLDSNFLRSIETGAFYGCENLTECVITNAAQEVSIESGAFSMANEDFCIYVPRMFLDSYVERYGEYNFSPIVSTVTFDSDGGSECEPMTMYYGDQITTLTFPTPQKAHHDFIGWAYADGNGEVIVPNGSTTWAAYSEEVTLEAKWQEWEYLIFFHTNGGDLTEEFYPYYYSSQGKVLPVPEKEGNEFWGWYDNPDFDGEPVTEIKAGDYGDKEYYAKWEGITYEVTLNYNDPDILNEVVEIKFGSEYTLTVVEKEGNIFNGWKYGNRLLTNDEGVCFCPWDIAENVELVPDLVPKIFAINVDKKNESIVWMTETNYDTERYDIEYGAVFAGFDELIAAFNPEKKNIVNGHKFVGFDIVNTDGDKEFRWEFESWNRKMPDLGENGSIYYIEARYVKEVDFKIVFMDGDEVISTFTGNYGATIVKPSIGKTGYNFNGWKVKGYDYDYINGFSGNCPVGLAIGDTFNFPNMPDLSWDSEEDGTIVYLEADFTPYQIAIAFMSYGGRDIGSTTVTFGAKTKLNVTIKAGYKFVGWYFSTNGTNGCGTQCTDSAGFMKADWDRLQTTTLYAKWTPIVYSISYILNGGVIRGSYPNKYTIESEEQFLPTNVEKDGYKFYGWYETADFSSGRVVSITKGSYGDKVFYAKYLRLHTVTYVPMTGGSLSVSGMVTGDKIKLLEKTVVGYNVYWQDNTTLKEYVEGTEFSMPDREVVFRYSKKVARTYTIRLYFNRFNTDSACSTYNVTYDDYYTLPLNYVGRSDYHFVGWCFVDSYISSAALHKERCTNEKGASFSKWNYDGSRDVIAAYCRNILDVADYTRDDIYIITDSGRFNQSYDDLQHAANYKLSELYTFGYRTIRIEMHINIAELYDGYQGILVYNGTSKYDTYLAGLEIDHGGNKNLKDFCTYVVEFDIPLTEGMADWLCIRYGASGVGKDDWKNSIDSIDVNVVTSVLPEKATSTKQ